MFPPHPGATQSLNLHRPPSPGGSPSVWVVPTSTSSPHSLSLSPPPVSLSAEQAEQSSREREGERGASGKKCLSLSPGQPGKRGGEGARESEREAGAGSTKGERTSTHCEVLRSGGFLQSVCLCVRRGSGFFFFVGGSSWLLLCLSL